MQNSGNKTTESLLLKAVLLKVHNETYRQCTFQTAEQSLDQPSNKSRGKFSQETHSGDGVSVIMLHTQKTGFDNGIQ